jgi:hypothetical protein
MRNVASRIWVAGAACVSDFTSAASFQNATTANSSSTRSRASAPTVAAAMKAFAPRIEPETSTISATARRLRARSRTMMSVSSGIGRSVRISSVRSRSMSSDP